MKIQYHWKRIFFDNILLILALAPAFIAFYTDSNKISNDLFLRSGAIMALFAAFLEFRTHEIQIQRIEDKFKSTWKMIGTLTEGLAKTDSATKLVLRQQSYLIQSAGIKPAMGKPEDIMDMVVTEKIKALQDLKSFPDSYYKYNSVISLIGKLLVVLGTLIWAFGDCVIKFFNSDIFCNISDFAK